MLESFLIVFLKNFPIFRGKHLCWSPAQGFPCEHCEISKNIYFEKHLPTATLKIHQPKNKTKHGIRP